MEVLEAKPRKFKEAILWTIGRGLVAACHNSSWFFPIYFAGRLKTGNVKNYEDAARFAKELEMPECYDALVEMARVDRNTKTFFRAIVAKHRFLPITRSFFRWG